INTERDPIKTGDITYDWIVLDSSAISKEGVFFLKNPVRFEKELCLIAFTKEAIKYGAYRGIVLLRNAPQDTLSWETTLKEVRKEVGFLHNLENAVLLEALNLIEKYEDIDENYRRKLLPELLSRTDKQYVQKYQQIEVQVAQSYDSLQRKIEDFRNKYKGTYAADVLLMIYHEPLIGNKMPQEYNTRASFMKEFYFEKWNFSEELLLSNPFLSNRIMRYLRDFTDIYNYAGIQYSVDKILKATKSQNSKLFDFMWNFLVKIYLHGGLEKMAVYIYDTYLEGCHAQISSGYEELRKLEKIKKVQEGNLAPVIPLEKQGIKPFAEIIKNHEFTIIYFWYSTCSFCQKATPEFVKSLEKATKNIGVITISLDKNKEEWRKYLKNMPSKWYHYCDLQGWKSEVVEEYVIRRTPTCYIIDKKGIIIGRDLYPLQVLPFITKYVNDNPNSNISSK
ncbi:MAG: thioredoxin-like domain-containing protein, partial [Raineya sp.]|nr:thioredoxin-like domain-containing protein [Raineya sp.]